MLSKDQGINSVFYLMSGFMIVCDSNTMLVHSANITTQPDTEERVTRTGLLINCLEMDDIQFSSLSTDEAFKQAVEMLKSVISTSIRGKLYVSPHGYEYMVTNTENYSISAIVNNMNH